MANQYIFGSMMNANTLNFRTVHKSSITKCYVTSNLSLPLQSSVCPKQSPIKTNKLNKTNSDDILFFYLINLFDFCTTTTTTSTTTTATATATATTTIVATIKKRTQSCVFSS